MPLDAAAVAQLPSVLGEVVYFARMAEKPRTLAYEPPPGVARSNIVEERHILPIHDMRPVADGLSLDREGFSLARAPSAVKDYDDEDEVRRFCYPETERYVAAAVGAERVVIFDHTIRKRAWGVADRTPGVARQPVTRIHGDYTETSGPQRVRDVMGAEADDLLRRRFAIINLWRPIRGPLRDAPLALCDARTVADADLAAQDLVYRDRVGEIYGLTWSPAHRWFYAPDMDRDEALFLKCFDSLRDGRARFMPHTSFRDPNAPADVLPRESIELRTLAFFST